VRWNPRFILDPSPFLFCARKGPVFPVFGAADVDITGLAVNHKIRKTITEIICPVIFHGNHHLLLVVAVAPLVSLAIRDELGRLLGGQGRRQQGEHKDKDAEKSFFISVAPLLNRGDQ